MGHLPPTYGDNRPSKHPLPEENVSHIDVVGYKPFPWQMAVHKAMEGSRKSGKIFVCKSKRQLGKSLMCANVLLWFCLNKPSRSIMVSPTLSQARKVFQDIISASDPRIIKKKNETLLEIEFINGGRIYFKSAEQRDSLRGYTVTGVLILDEAAYLDDSILELVLPWTSVYNAPILIVSTPKMRSGFFYRYYMQGLDEDYPNVVTIDWNDYDTSALLTKERVEMFRQVMPKGQFRSEILGEFVDEGTGVFNIQPETYIQKPADGSYGSVYLGIDFANGDGGDWTVVSGFDEGGRQVVLEYFKDRTPLQQVDEIGRILRRYGGKVRCVLAEKNSMGLTFIDLLRDKNPGVNIQEFVTSNTTKREIIDSLVAGIGSGNCRLIDDHEQRKEMECYQMEVTRTGAITYNGYGSHDDIVMANAFAWKARLSNSGNYMISFV